MKKFNEDLEITDIDISMYGNLKGAEVTFKFMDQYFARAMYFEKSTGNSWFETSGKSSKVHEFFAEEVEENETEIIDWINEQIKNSEL